MQKVDGKQLKQTDLDRDSFQWAKCNCVAMHESALIDKTLCKTNWNISNQSQLDIVSAFTLSISFVVTNRT